jgi:hypothetical protein
MDWRVTSVQHKNLPIAQGRPLQSLEVEPSPLRKAFDRMSTQELEAYAREGVLPEWFPKEKKDETVQ